MTSINVFKLSSFCVPLVYVGSSPELVSVTESDTPDKKGEEIYCPKEQVSTFFHRYSVRPFTPSTVSKVSPKYNLAKLSTTKEDGE